MLKNKIYKYFSFEIGKTFLIILFAFTSIAWTVRAVNFLDLVVDNGHSIKTYAQFSLLNITNIITKFIPLSFLLALVISIMKFQRQNELIILWTTGLNKINVVNLFFKISLIVFVLQLSFATYITPNALNKSRNLIKVSDLESISSVIKVNNFSDAFKGLTFYVEQKDQSGLMRNIFIRDNNNSLKGIVSDLDTSDTTIVAKTGYAENKKLILFNGFIQTKNKNNKIDNINFSKTEFAINNLKSRSIIVPKLQETFTSFLLQCLKINKNNISEKIDGCPKNSKNDLIVTISRRLGMPIYIPLISLICSFLLVSVKTKKYNFFNKYIYFLISFIILVLAEILVRYSGFTNLNTILYFLFPIVLMPITYVILIKKFAFEKIG